jgi:plasmid stability protein
MPRTTVNLDASVLRDLKRRAKDEGKSLGDVISQILAATLTKGSRTPTPSAIRWHAAPMGPPKVDLEDKEAVRQALGNR